MLALPVFAKYFLGFLGPPVMTPDLPPAAFFSSLSPQPKSLLFLRAATMISLNASPLQVPDLAIPLATSRIPLSGSIF